MESSNLRRKDTTKGPALRVLSLDGGGVRGYSMLILLQELMYRTYVEIEGKAPRRDQIPKPCDHFDLIAGTGTGGLIAIMLGRLRLDLETCKEVYVRMTRKVFETDKTIAGIPYRSTLFKASKLEEAIRECVREHTIFEDEGNDGILPPPSQNPMSPTTPMSNFSTSDLGPQRTMSRASNMSGFTSPYRQSTAAIRWGNPNALLYDTRENRTKTAVTAVYKGTQKHGNSALLRSYDSRKEPSPEFNCTIWQAGRATSATGLAFKPIQIGQSVFIDEGAGKYNPAPQILDEAAVSEWPGREVGVFVTIGTGKRPGGTSQQGHLWWEGFVSSAVGDFAEARRRLIAKIEGCEETHQYMLREHLSKRNVNLDNYFRFNVEVGVGEFGMNEWNRLADISTSTRRYLAKNEVQRMNVEAAAKIARIHKARMRHATYTTATEIDGSEITGPLRPLADPTAAELPDNDAAARPGSKPPSYSVPSQPYEEKFTVISSDEYPEPVPQAQQQKPPPLPSRSHELAPDGLGSNRPSNEYNQHPPPRSSNSSFVPSPRRSGEVGRPSNDQVRPSPPPLPPKTPLPYPEDTDPRHIRHGPGNSNGSVRPPYPDDGPPPPVNHARKPQFGGR